IRAALNRLLGHIFDVHRTRGKVREWYAGVEDRATIEAAQALLASAKKLQFLGSDGRHLGAGLPGLDAHAVSGLAPRGPAIGGERGGRLLAVPPRSPRSAVETGLRSVLRRVVFARRLFHAARAADRRLQDRLASAADPRWLGRYQRLRGRLKGLL